MKYVALFVVIAVLAVGVLLGCSKKPEAEPEAAQGGKTTDKCGQLMKKACGEKAAGGGKCGG